MIEADIRDSFRHQAEACRTLGSPFTARLCDLAAQRLDRSTAVGRRILSWSSDASYATDAVALRLMGALHALVLTGASAGLAAVYPPNHEEIDDARLWAVVGPALVEHQDHILAWLGSAPQTNEVRRCAALVPGFLLVARRFGLPLVLSELGASAGLNLFWDRYAYRLGGVDWGPQGSSVLIAPDWSGPPPPRADIRIAERAACDLKPLDPGDEADRLRLQSYVWADQKDRLQRTRAALAIAAEASERVEAADAVEWLARRLATPHQGHVHIVYHSIAWQYFPAASQRQGLAALHEASRRADWKAPLAWLRLEADGRSPGAAILLTLWPDGAEHEIGRADFHGRWVRWTGIVEDDVLNDVGALK